MSVGVQVDVIILSWNRLAETIAAIESALGQHGISKRVIVVDQGSADTNLGQLRRFIADQPAVTLKELGRNVGVAEGRNLATELGSAPYVVSLDNDALFADPDVLAGTVHRFDREPDLRAIAFRIVNLVTRRDEFVATDDLAEEHWTTQVSGAGHAIRRRAFEEAGGYDGALFFWGEERDLGYRILNAGYRIGYIPGLVVLHRADNEACLHWRDGRYYYVVRNTLYTHYKFGVSPSMLLLFAVAGAIKGARNGILLQVLRAVADASAMARRHSRSADKKPYQLNASAKAYIRACQRMTRESFWSGVRRPFAKLPDLRRAYPMAQPPG